MQKAWNLILKKASLVGINSVNAVGRVDLLVCMKANSASFLAEISVRSPREFIMFVIYKFCSGSKCQTNISFDFENRSTENKPLAIRAPVNLREGIHIFRMWKNPRQVEFIQSGRAVYISRLKNRPEITYVALL